MAPCLRESSDVTGAAAAKALMARFDAIRKAEWSRLGRKVASLDQRQRAEVEAIVASVVRALAEPPAQRLATARDPQLPQAALRLFELSDEFDRVTAR